MLGDWADEDLLKTTAEVAAPAPPDRGRRHTSPCCWRPPPVHRRGVRQLDLRQWPSTVAGPTTPVAGAADYALGNNPFSVDVPPLDESDSVVAELVAKAVVTSTRGGVARNQGSDPEFHGRRDEHRRRQSAGLARPALRPASAFTVVQRGAATYIDPQSYERYAPLADAVASVDPAGSARLYATLKPRIEEAYRDLGVEPLFDRTLERAIVLLLNTPVLDSRLP